MLIKMQEISKKSLKIRLFTDYGHRKVAKYSKKHMGEKI